MKPGGIVRLSSRVLVAASLAYMPLALAEAALGRYPLHALMMAGGFLPAFVAGVAVSYAASALTPRRAFAAAGRLAALALAGGLLALALPTLQLAGIDASLGLYALAYTLTAIGLLQALPPLASAPFSVKASIGGLGLAYLLASAYTAYQWAKGLGASLTWALGLIYSIPITSIYAVTIHSLPRTYRGEPRRALVLALYTLQAAGIAAYSVDVRAGAALLTIPLILYPPAARFELLREAFQKASKLRGPARGSHLYYTWGHIAVLAIVAAAVAAAASYTLTPGYHRFILLVHTLTLGFTACHIAIHAPLMLPVILGVRTSKRYNPAPYILLLAALAAYPANETVSLAAFAAAVLATLLIVWP